MVNDSRTTNDGSECCGDDATTCPVDDERHSFLKILSNRIQLNGTINLLSDEPIDLSRDLLLGSGASDWFYPEHFLKPHLELVVYDMISEGSAKIQVLEIASSNHLLSPILQSYADESLLYDQTVLIYTLFHPSPINLEPRIISSVQKVEQFDVPSLPSRISSSITPHHLSHSLMTPQVSNWSRFSSISTHPHPIHHFC